MTDSGSFSSLMALVDSHLSQTSLQDSPSSDGKHLPMPALIRAKLGPLSDTQLKLPNCQNLPVPSLSLSANPIQNVLAEQVANMLKTKAVKRQQDDENARLQEEMNKLKMEEDNCVIDLMQALQPAGAPRPQSRKEEAPSSSGSFESLLFESKLPDDVPQRLKTPEPLLPCNTDMSYILYQKIKKGKPSAFGRVLCSHLKPVAAPYLRTKIRHNIVVFDFSTPSPCDINKEKAKKRTCTATYIPDIMNIF